MSRILANVRSDAKALDAAGLIDPVTMREIESLCIAPVRRYSASEIQAIRARANLSQAVFARVLNVGPTTVQKWEQGSKRPGGASLRLLQIADTKGIGVLLPA